MNIMKSFAIAAAMAAAWAAAAPDAQAVTRVQRTFGPWQVDCTERDNGKKNCVLQYALVAKKDKRPVFSWSIVRRGKDAAGDRAVIRTPTGVLLANGVNVGFEGADPVKINYVTCGPRACLAEFDFTDDWLNALESKKKVLVSYNAANDKPIKHEIELAQFKAAFEFYTAQIKDAK